MKIFSTDIPNDRNIYGDNIATKMIMLSYQKLREINGLWDDVLFYVIQQAYSEPSLKHYSKAFLLI